MGQVQAHHYRIYTLQAVLIISIENATVNFTLVSLCMLTVMKNRSIIYVVEF